MQVLTIFKELSTKTCFFFQFYTGLEICIYGKYTWHSEKRLNMLKYRIQSLARFGLGSSVPGGFFFFSSTPFHENQISLRSTPKAFQDFRSRAFQRWHGGALGGISASYWSSRVPRLILASGYCVCGVSHVHVAFLPTPKTHSDRCIGCVEGRHLAYLG